MRIGVIADTHISKKALPGFISETFTGVKLILHAGDIGDPSVLSYLSSIAPTQAVAGNVDSPGMVETLGTSKLLTLQGYRVGLTHGHLGPGRTTQDRAYNAFRDRADIIVFGHSHQALSLDRQGVLMLNPGSPTDKRRAPHFSLAILTLTNRIDSEILYFE